MLTRLSAISFVTLLLSMLPVRAGAIGLLIPTDQSLEPLMIQSHRVAVEVRDRAAETRVEQVFVNNTDRVLEATYVFPVPAGSTVSEFAMVIGGRRVRGEVLERDQARQIYEGIVARMQDPGLLEYLGGNLFRARVFPIPARGTQRVELTFASEIPYESGVLHYTYPLKTGGRAARTLNDFTLAARIASQTPLRAVYSPTHSIAVHRQGDRGATAGFEYSSLALERDFDLYWSVSDRDVGLSLLTHRPDGQDGYFLMMVAPRAEVTDNEIIGKHMTFVIDTSGSMAGEKMERARAALDYCLSRLRSDDTFNVIAFSTDVQALRSSSVVASTANIRLARDFVRGLTASGGTAIHPAFMDALQRLPRNTGTPTNIVFVTDGMPTVGLTDAGAIVDDVTRRNRSQSSSRIFVFGVGDDVNTTFLDRISAQNRGFSEYARDGSETEALLTGFYNKVAFPVLANAALQMPAADVYDVYPRDLGDLYRGGQLLIVGRYRRALQGEVVLTGTLGRDQRRFAYGVSFAQTEPDNAFLPTLWATRKIGHLLDAIRLNGESAELRDSVIVLSRRYGIVTPYTSYLVTEEQAATSQPADESSATYSMLRDDVVDGRLERPGTAAPFAQRRGQSNPADTLSRSTLGPVPRSAPSAAAAPGPSTARPMRPAPPEPANEQSGGEYGESGRRISAGLRSMREAERSETGSVLRYVQGRMFSFARGRWVDSGFREGMRILRIRYGSSAFFTLLRLRPELRAMLALGRSVTVVVAGRAVEVSGSGADVSDEQVRSFMQ